MTLSDQSRRAKNELGGGIYALGLVPIVIGVTGHRDIPASDVDALAKATRAALDEIALSSPNSPHVLLSSLAEGADRIAAQVALDKGWTLGVTLPASAEIYALDFKTAESQADFRSLMSKAAWVDVLPAEALTPAAYRAAGLRIARQAFYLLAYWDGDVTISDGGTADIVYLFLHGIPESAMAYQADNFLPDARPVWHILTPRSRAPDLISVSDVGRLSKLAPEPCGASGNNELQRWGAVMRRIDLFNADAAACLKNNPASVERVRKDIEKVVVPDISASAKAASVLHAVAGVISEHAQGQRNRELLWLFGLALTAVFCEQIYSGPIWAAGWLAAAIGSGALATTLFLWGARAKLEDRYLDYRALAEACRVQYFWKRAGISACAADHFLRDQRDELEWLRQAVRTTELLPGIVVTDTDRIEGVARDWIDGQRKWFIGDGSSTVGKAGWNDAQDKKLSNLAGWLFKGGIAVAVVLMLLHAFVVPFFGKTEEDALQWLIVAYGMLFGTAGMVAVYLGVKAFPEQARAYRRMGLVMGVARRHLDASLAHGDIDAAKNVLLGAGRDALEENGGWLLLHRDRPAQVPLG